MFIFTLNSSNLLTDKKGTVGHYKVIATSSVVNGEILQKVADIIKSEFGLILDTTCGKTSDPETFLSIDNVPFLD